MPLFLFGGVRLHVLGLLAMAVAMPAAVVQLIGGMPFTGAKGDNGKTGSGHGKFAEGFGAHWRDSSHLL